MATSDVHAGTREEAWWLRFPAYKTVHGESGWRRRVRYWLNSFRGFAAFDVRGIDPR